MSTQEEIDEARLEWGYHPVHFITPDGKSVRVSKEEDCEAIAEKRNHDVKVLGAEIDRLTEELLIAQMEGGRE